MRLAVSMACTLLGACSSMSPSSAVVADGGAAHWMPQPIPYAGTSWFSMNSSSGGGPQT